MISTPHVQPLLDDLAARLAAREQGGLVRRLALPAGRDVTSNDYLGFAADPALRERILARLDSEPADAPVGAAAARLLRGTHPAHLALELRLAALTGQPAALLLPSGYQANLALLGALLGPADRALSDAANHASIIDGLRLSGCHKVIVPHLDVDALAAALATPHPGGRTVVVTESHFSMDGDVAPLDRIAALCARHGAGLIVDEAHAIGLWGEARRGGLVEHFGIEDDVLAVVGTGGKALGLAGAWIAGPQVVIDTVVNFGRGFVFSTAVPPLTVAALDAALDHLAAHPERGPRVRAAAHGLRTVLSAAGLDVRGAADSPIVPVVLGDNERAMAVAARVRECGFDVRAVRPPTVPAGSARLRLSVHANHDQATLAALADACIASLDR